MAIEDSQCCSPFQCLLDSLLLYQEINDHPEHLPLNNNKTLETLDQVKSPSNKETSLPDPELYIIVYGKLSKGLA